MWHRGSKALLAVSVSALSFYGCARFVFQIDYSVVFDSPVTDVRFDGGRIALNDQGVFHFGSYQAEGETHRLAYTKANGKRVELELYPAREDSDSNFLVIRNDSISGTPQFKEVPTIQVAVNAREVGNRPL